MTGDYGMGVVAGQIVMASGMVDASPAGVRVAVGGTGMSEVVGADGRFAFTGVPEGAQLIFERQSDGVNARLSLASTSAPVLIELGKNTAALARRTPPGPQQQIEGLVTAASATSLTVHDSHGNDVVLAITAATVIRKGGTMLTPADLTVGLRVHVAASTDASNTKTAVLVIVQDDKEDGNDDQAGHATMTANGPIKSVGTDSLVVTSQPKGDVTVQVDANTIIRKQGVLIHLADLKVGDEVNTMGKRVDDHTLLARQIEVRGNDHENHPEEMNAGGAVKAVGSSGLTVTTSHGDVTVQVDGATRIRKQGKTIQLSDVQVGDSVEAEGQKIDDHTLLARSVEVKGGGGHH